MLCTTCDTHNDADARYCRVCGVALNAPAGQGQRAAAPRPVYTITNVPMSGSSCPSCGRINPAGARYCVYCASALQLVPSPALQPAYAMPGGYSAPQTVALTINMTSSGNLVLRAVWFFFIGWWLGLLWSLCAWLFNLTLIGLPIGLMMLSATPTVTTLQQRPRQLYGRPVGPQHPLALRAIWFALVGWWASLIWLLVAWGLSLTLVLMPISFWMWNRIPTVTTLAAEQ